MHSKWSHEASRASSTRTTITDDCPKIGPSSSCWATLEMFFFLSFQMSTHRYPQWQAGKEAAVQLYSVLCRRAPMLYWVISKWYTNQEDPELILGKNVIKFASEVSHEWICEKKKRNEMQTLVLLNLWNESCKLWHACKVNFPNNLK